MCHRYGIRAIPEEIAVALHPDLLLPKAVPFWPSSDVYPLATVPVIRLNDDAEWELAPMQWGLLPFWWKPKTEKDKPASLQRKSFNARAETIHSKPSFRAAFKSRRCIVPASEFYEGPNGHAAYFSLADAPVMAFAGLWETWRSDGEMVESCTIVTTTANDLVAEYHPRKRMRVILPDEHSRRLWMSPDILEREPLDELFAPIASFLMIHRQADSA